MKNPEKVSVFEIKGFEVVAENSAYCFRNTSEINVLAKSLKIYDQNKSDFFQLNLPEIHGEKG